MPEQLPDDVCRLLLEDIEGYEQLEVLLFLREHASEDWTRDRIGERLGIDPALAASTLACLVARGLVEPRGGASFRYMPRTQALERTVSSLAAAYDDERRLQVMKVMNASAMQRLRHGAARVFADAFVVGRDKKDG